MEIPHVERICPPRDNMQVGKLGIVDIHLHTGEAYLGKLVSFGIYCSQQGQPNAYGEYPGYRILPFASPIHLTVVNSADLVNAVNWATHDLMVTTQHDTEPRSVHPYNNQDVFNSTQSIFFLLRHITPQRSSAI